MKIYRIEDKNDPTIGAFRADDSPAWQAEIVARATGAFPPFCHPLPKRPPGDFPLHYYCGLPSLDAYRVWFSTPEVRAALWSQDTHHMRIYEVPDDLVSLEMIQVTFKLTDAIAVGIVPEEELV